MPAVRAHALLSATRSHSLPRVAANSTSQRQQWPRRGFHTTASRFVRPDDSNGGKGPDAPGSPAKPPQEEHDAAQDKSSPNGKPGQAADTYRETLRSQGYGSARSRAMRQKPASEELAPVELPDWFLEDHVKAGWHQPSLLFDGLNEEDTSKLQEHLEAALDMQHTETVESLWLHPVFKTMWPRVEFRAHDLTGALENENNMTVAFERMLESVKRYRDVAYLLALSYTYPKSGEGLGHGKYSFARIWPKDLLRLPWLHGQNGPLPMACQRWIAHAPVKPPFFGTLTSEFVRRAENEYEASMELLVTVNAELSAKVPDDKRTKEFYRPVTVLSVVNHRGSSVARRVVNDVAREVKADVVHLDAAALADIVGTYLGQNMYSARGPFSMLGYAAAEVSGRLATRTDPPEEEGLSYVSVVPSRGKSATRSWAEKLMTGLTSGQSSEERWEELKLNRILEEIILSSERHDSSQRLSNRGEERKVIIHIHNYVELSTIPEGANILNKIRVIANRLWQRGRRVIVVGSSSGNAAEPHWRNLMATFNQEDSHVIPFFYNAYKQRISRLEKQENFGDNARNIAAMLRSLAGTEVPIQFARSAHNSEEAIGRSQTIKGLDEAIYDVHWVYRIASVMLGMQTPRANVFDMRHLQQAYEFMAQRDDTWKSSNPGMLRPPYYTPFVLARDETAPDDSPLQQMFGMSRSGKRDSMDDREKKLASGLVNAADIKTTFDEIVCPEQTRESLMTLTTLSLVRPDAFSYGILAAERIPGCLLYGPPGTGKTLMAKAVAKQSGANMLEVSAASINDMWVGNSEKNVRALFTLARKKAPCVIFLDEADGLLGQRGGKARATHRDVINQFLREWDGLTTDITKAFIFLMVATNRPFDLDEAVLRRLPRKILVDLPLKPEREKILRVMLRDEELDPTVDILRLAEQTELYSGSDLKNLCVAAAMEAVKEEMAAAKTATQESGEALADYKYPEKRVLTKTHFEKAIREISASVSEDMETLKAIRKFDEQYGDSKRKKKRSSMGFGVLGDQQRGTEDARVRHAVAAA